MQGGTRENLDTQNLYEGIQAILTSSSLQTRYREETGVYRPAHPSNRCGAMPQLPRDVSLRHQVSAADPDDALDVRYISKQRLDQNIALSRYLMYMNMLERNSGRSRTMDLAQTKGRPTPWRLGEADPRFFS
jgi:hypothetical protein